MNAPSAPVEVPEASRAALLWVVSLLREGYTGRIELECHGGSVRRAQTHQVFEPRSGQMHCRGGGETYKKAP